jgi:phenylpropionate dioxygenase-like ring-hydroxylating dioxygenase large terminal subunit
MRQLDRWIPVALGRRLGRKPLALRIEDRDLVLFRTPSGQVGVLNDVCPHRGMRLSKGCVDGERLVCPYHGWNFDVRGEGRSPGNPRLCVAAEALDVAERYGAVWIKERGSDAALPDLNFPGFNILSVHDCDFNASVELLLDNFSEVEHTATAHWVFGYDPKHVGMMRNETIVTDQSVTIESSGPQKHIPWWMRFGMAARTGDTFEVRQTVYYHPLYSTYDWWWVDPATGQERPDRFKEVAFFHHVGQGRSRLFSFHLWNRPNTGLLGFNRLARFVASQIVRYEIAIDRWLLENVHDEGNGRSRRLGRFDRVVTETRKRLPLAPKENPPRRDGEHSGQLSGDRQGEGQGVAE